MASLGGSGGAMFRRWPRVVTAVAISETPDSGAAFNPCCSVEFVVVLESRSLFVDAERPLWTDVIGDELKVFVIAISPPACPAAVMFSSSGGGGGGSGLEGGRERCEAPFVLVPVLVAGHEDGGDFFGTEGGVRVDEMAVAEEDVAGAVADLELVLDRPC
jgi:hypothetical protein